MERLGREKAVLVVDKTGDAKASGYAVGVAAQYSGAIGGVGVCQVKRDHQVTVRSGRRWQAWHMVNKLPLGKTHAGLDQGQVTSWHSWHRRSLFSMIATIVLTLTQAATAARTGPDSPAHLIPLTCPELLRLLRAPALPTPARDRDHLLHWAIWRRRHQAISQACHRRRHLIQDQP